VHYNNNLERDIRTFGRIKSRKLSINKQSLLQDFLPNFEIGNFNQILPLLNKGTFEKIIIEIGSGFGHFIFKNAINNPQNFFIACEPHINGVVNILAMMQKYSFDNNKNINNLVIYKGDAREIIKLSSDNFFDEIYVLFPDPWPKTKQQKRRIVNQENLNLLAQKSKIGASLTIATDHDSYKTAIVSCILQNINWFWLANNCTDWQIFPQNWVETKYQKKALQEGRNSVIFQLINQKL